MTFRRPHLLPVLCAALVLMASPVLCGAAAPPAARLALIIGVNHSSERDKVALRYADDDAARFFDLFRLLGTQTFLLSRLDDNTRRLHPQAALEASLPRLAELRRAVRAAAEQVRTGRSRGIKTELYLFFAGHGDIQQGQGYLALEDGRLTASMLRDQVIRAIGAHRTHLIVDACHAYFMASPRGPGGRRRPLHGFIKRSTLPPSVGVLLSSSASRQSHEWEGFQAGVFSHTVRSGLYGAADADADGLVTYREIAAFVERANASVENDRFRSHIFARAPRGSSTLMDLRGQRVRQLLIAPKQHGRYLLEDFRGIRLADFHSSAAQSLRLLRPGQGLLYLRRLPGGKEYAIPPTEAAVELSSLSPQQPRTAMRGAADHAFTQLFRLPFDRSFVQAYAFAEAVDESPTLSMSNDTDAAPRWRKIGGWSALGLGSAALVSGVALTLSAKSLHDGLPEDESHRDRVARNDAIDRRNISAVVLYSLAGASALSAAILLLWPDAPMVAPAAGPAGGGLTLGGQF